ncbi:MAG: exodeoxyribonuclease VII large subunit, partial [Opitutales bacterium]
IVRHVMLDGAGQLQMEFDRLKSKLADEGLFDDDKKRRIPVLPSRIGFVTSPTGAAVKDFISVLRRRGWRGEVFVVPSKVQGEEAPVELLEGLRISREMKGLDLVVIGRGGGSVEDLWAFNDETLVREIANFPIPLISAVGHQIDFVLTDFAADLRAETPSAAAEIVSNGFLEATERWRFLSSQLDAVVVRALDDCLSKSRLLTARLRASSPLARMENLSLRVDDLGNRLANCLREATSLARERLATRETKFALVDPGNRLCLERAKLDGLTKRLKGLSVESTLRRGFSLVTDSDGRSVRRRDALKAGQEVRTRFADGEVPMRVLE